MDDRYSWKEYRFRRHIIERMVDVVIQGKKNIPRSVIEEMEANVFKRASDKDDYLDLTAKLLLTLKELQPNHSFEKSNWNSEYSRKHTSNLQSYMSLPSLLQLQIPNPGRDRSYNRAPEEPIYGDKRDWYSSKDRFSRGVSPRTNQDRGREERRSEDNHSHLYSESRLSGSSKIRDDRAYRSMDKPISPRSRFERNERDNRKSTEGRRAAPVLERRYDRSEIYPKKEIRRSPIPNNLGTSKHRDERYSTKRSRSPPSEAEAAKRIKYKLSGAAFKKIKRLVQEGIPYEVAKNMLIEERQQKEIQTDRKHVAEKKPHPLKVRPLPKPSVAERRVSPIRKRPSIPQRHEPPIKRSQPSNNTSKTQPSPQNDDLQIGIVDKSYPSFFLSNRQLHTLQESIMRAVEDIPDSGPQVRFQDCSYHPGLLLLKCVDKRSLNWIIQNVERLRPWEGVKLKTVNGKEVVTHQICSALIPDDVKGTKLSDETVLTRLKKMNHGLLTQYWKVINCDDTKSGRLYTFSVDSESMKILQNLRFKPYFGFGQIEFKRLVKSK